MWANQGDRASQAGQGDGKKEVTDFLQRAGLQMYASLLIRNGFDELETLLAIEDADLLGMGVPTYHTLRIRQLIQEARRQTGYDQADSNPVTAFLENIGLGQYAGRLLQAGFDDMETLSLVEHRDLQDLGFPRGHAVKLKKRLQDHELEAASKDDSLYYSMRGTPATPMPARQMPCVAPAVEGLRGPVGTGRTLGQAPIRPARRAPPVISAPKPSSMDMYNPSDQTKSAVEESWEKVQAHGSAIVGELLYRHTFRMDPQAMDLFPLHVRQKYKEWSADEIAEEEADIWQSAALKKLFSKWVNAIGCTVAGLHNMNKLVPMLTKLGARHMNYGVAEERWQVVGKALQCTLQEILKEDYTPEVQTAWVTVYNFMASVMIQGLRQATEAAQCTTAPVPSRTGSASVGSTLPEGDDANSQCSTGLSALQMPEIGKIVGVGGHGL